jgi:hypothetical protein
VKKERKRQPQRRRRRQREGTEIINMREWEKYLNKMKKKQLK